MDTNTSIVVIVSAVAIVGSGLALLFSAIALFRQRSDRTITIHGGQTNFGQAETVTQTQGRLPYGVSGGLEDTLSYLVRTIDNRLA